MAMWNAGNHSALVLIVDDVPGNRAILMRRLARIGYRCAEADSGQVALEHMQQERPDIVLLDYMMPGMSGIDTLHVMKGDSATSGIPVIMVTAKTTGDAIAEALAAGADDYVTKPIDFTNLDARMKNVLRRTHDRSEMHKINTALDQRAVMRSLELVQMQEDLESEKSLRNRMEGEQMELCRACMDKRQADLAARMQSLELLAAQCANCLDTIAGKSPPDSAELDEAQSLLVQLRASLAQFSFPPDDQAARCHPPA